MPDQFLIQKNESFEVWRDRLYHEYRIPVILAALNDIKAPYVEIINPLLSRQIINTVRKLPDHLRTNKKIFKSIVCSVSPNISFAKNSAVSSPKNILKSKQATEFLKKELLSSYVESILPSKFIEYVLDQLEKSDNSKKYTKAKKLKDLMRIHAPIWLAKKIPNIVKKPEMDFNLLAFRAYMICQMNKTLTEDVEDSTGYSS